MLLSCLLQVVSGLIIPRLPTSALPEAVALFGSLIMPHNIYLHSALVQTRRLATSSSPAKREAIKYFGIESALSLVVSGAATGFVCMHELCRLLKTLILRICFGSVGNFQGCLVRSSPGALAERPAVHQLAEVPPNFMHCCNFRLRQIIHQIEITACKLPALQVSVFINLFVVSVFAAGFYGKPEADTVGLQNAGHYLGETYGSVAVYVWALGLLAAGQSSTMTGTYTGQFVMSGYLDIQISPWARVLLTRLVSVVPTLLVATIYSSSNSLDTLNQWLNLLQSVQLPFALIPVLAFNMSPRIMGQGFSNPGWLNTVSWLIALIVIGINMVAVHAFADAFLTEVRPVTWWLFIAAVVLYMCFVVYLVVKALLPMYLGPKDSRSAGSDHSGGGDGDHLRQRLLPALVGDSPADEQAKSLLLPVARDSSGASVQDSRPEAADGPAPPRTAAAAAAASSSPTASLNELEAGAILRRQQEKDSPT